MFNCGLPPVHDTGAVKMEYVNPNLCLSVGPTWTSYGTNDAKDVCQRQACGGEKTLKAN